MGNYFRAAKGRISGKFINDVVSTGLLPYKLTNLVCSPNGKWIPFSKTAQHLKMPFDAAKGRTDAKLRMVADGRSFSPSLRLIGGFDRFSFQCPEQQCDEHCLGDEQARYCQKQDCLCRI